MITAHSGEDEDPFAALHPVLAHHIVNTLGWRNLRPLQRAAIRPLLAGADAVLLAPTAGGKTEAALFPLLTAMDRDRRRGLSVLYLCPIKALLNNLAPRVGSYTDWIGRRTALWHGDIGAGARRALLREPSDILLTTPESLEAMLVSVNVDEQDLFRSLAAVVIDEVHAFASDDRGWHLLAVLERLSRLCGRPLQRIGLSATVGNPEQLAAWLQGANPTGRKPEVIAAGTGPLSPHPRAADLELDYVGSLENAARVIAALHTGQKRLVFCDARRQVEQLGQALNALGVQTFLSHASLSADERRRSETAFAEARDCVIIATSTLELGIDVGDLDRVIQIDAPNTVASFLQRLGRTGRRPQTERNCLFLATGERQLLQAAGLLHLWGQGFVERVAAPPEPLHLVAQQVMALCLQKGRVGDRLWEQEWNGLTPFDAEAAPIVEHLRSEGFLDADGGMLFVGPTAEHRFGRRHFMELTASFTAPPQFTVLAGRTEIGQVEPGLLTAFADGPRRILLAGRSWQITFIDWARRRCQVEPADGGGRARWGASAERGGLSFELTQAMRTVLLGEDPPVRLTRRAETALAKAREKGSTLVHPDGLIIDVGDRATRVRWWTWAGHRANLTLAASLTEAGGPGWSSAPAVSDRWIAIPRELTFAEWKEVSAIARNRPLRAPAPDPNALQGLKFSEALPKQLAERVLATRLADYEGARHVFSVPTHWHAGRDL
ncbi:DEAD/DEAH box helicase [Actinospica robiniae]|uniref:DEAD/DEAH box helicase n=1 Tax=Actinospica robiniae TaxID=304901 RepID=UPI00040C6628|nr:DEAD/DEAH box helicase [Actinospica robiniae]